MSDDPGLPDIEEIVRAASPGRRAATTFRPICRRSRGTWSVAFVLAISLAATGCAGASSSIGSQTQAGPAASPPALSPSAGPSESSAAASSLPPELAGSVAVSFSSDDGIRIEGRLFGSGSVGVILVHGNEPEAAQATWFPFAGELARAGYLVLSFDLRGFCPGGLAGCSAGSVDPPNSWHDLVGAIANLKQRGARAIVPMGASLGSGPVLWAATHGATAAGLVLVSTRGLKAALAYSPGYDFTPAMLARISEPKLFVASLHDATAPDAAATAKAMYLLVRQPKELVLIDSIYHGAELFTGDGPGIKEAQRVVLAFLSKYRSIRG